MVCENCDHSADVHRGGKECRVTGCDCIRLRVTQLDPGMRQVTLDLPPGYILNVQLVPIGEAKEVTDD